MSERQEQNNKLFPYSYIILIILRVLSLAGIATFLIMGLCANRDYIPKFAISLAVISIIVPELTIELLTRDFYAHGIFNISRRIRLALIPPIYGIGYVISPYLFHAAFRIFACKGRSLGGNTTSLQYGLWRVILNPPPVSGYWIFVVPVTIGLLMTSFALSYLATSKSRRRSIAAITLFVLLEVAAAMAAYNFPC